MFRFFNIINNTILIRIIRTKDISTYSVELFHNPPRLATHSYSHILCRVAVVGMDKIHLVDKHKQVCIKQCRTCHHIWMASVVLVQCQPPKYVVLIQLQLTQSAQLDIQNINNKHFCFVFGFLKISDQKLEEKLTVWNQSFCHFDHNVKNSVFAK